MRIVIVLLFGILAGLGLALYLRGCDRFNPDQPPELIEEEEIDEGLPPERPGRLRGITHRQNPVRQEGLGKTTVAKKKAIAFAKSAQDTTLPPELPEVKLLYEDERLDLAVGDSRGVVHRQVTSCPEPCEAGTRDNQLFSESPRGLFRPDWKKDIVHCGLMTGAGAAVGGGAYDAPAEGAIVGFTVCGAYKLARAAF